MHQPIWVLRSGTDPAAALCAEILRCEGLPWLESMPLEDFRDVPPEVRLLLVVGRPLSASSIERLAITVASMSSRTIRACGRARTMGLT